MDGGFEKSRARLRTPRLRLGLSHFMPEALNIGLGPEAHFTVPDAERFRASDAEKRSDHSWMERRTGMRINRDRSVFVIDGEVVLVT